VLADRNEFQSWNLHDAVLKTITADWQERVCIATLSAFLEADRATVDCAIRWEGVTSVQISHRSPWGESLNVNQQRVESGEDFVLEMQSGDEIRVVAAAVRLEP
jgi:hypothetical protein